MMAYRDSYYTEGIPLPAPGNWPVDAALEKAAANVKERVEEIAQSSRFLRTVHPQTNIPLFDRREIEALQILGTGGFSQVRLIANFHLYRDGDKRKRSLAEYARQGRAQYALKHLRPELVRNLEDFESAAIDLSMEVHFLTRLNHPNIVKVRGLAKGGTDSLGCSHDGYFIVMDRLEPLDARIHRWRDRLYRFPGYRPVSFGRKINYGLQIADAIAYLHENAIIYRDLKVSTQNLSITCFRFPHLNSFLTFYSFVLSSCLHAQPANVGFNMQDWVQLFDFGLSRELPQGNRREDGTYLMSGVGTRRFMAPEIVNSNCYNEKVDVYAWAMTTLEMLTLQKPFPHYSTDQHAEMVCNRAERPLLNPYDIPMVLINVLEDAWAQDVTTRLDMAGVCRRLRPLLGCSDHELFQMSVGLVSRYSHVSLKTNAPSVCKENSDVHVEVPEHFQQLLDCEILSECSDEMDSCMDLTLTTTASTTWQDSVSTVFS